MHFIERNHALFSPNLTLLILPRKPLKAVKMAQKKAVTVKGKKATNGEEKPLAKRVTKSTKVQEEETVVPQSPSKKFRKQPVKEVPQFSEEDESDVEEQNDEQPGDDSDFEVSYKKNVVF